MIELPEGWCFAGLAELGIARMGPTILAKELSAAGTPVYSAGQENTRWGFTEKDVPVFDAGTLVISARGTIGFPKIPADTVFTSTQTTILVRPLASIESRYFCYFLKKIDWKEVASGAAIPMLTISMLGELQFQLAPLPEQKRIADKLDALLARVDAARARLDRIPGLLKRFRQSVLAAATSGELTAEWRDQHATYHWRKCEEGFALPDGYRRLSKQRFEISQIEHDEITIPDSWALESVASLYRKNILIDFADGNHGSLYPRKNDFGARGVLFLTASQVDECGSVALGQCPRLSFEKASQITKGWAKNGDVLLSHNATIGRVCVLEGLAEEVLLGTSLTFYRFNQNGMLAKYAAIAFRSDFFQNQLKSVMQQTTRDQVPITKQVGLHVICPPIEEQTEIVRRVEALFALADKVQTQYSAARARIDKLTASILAKAFRGELVPQDPNDEPASVLLERLRAKRDAAPAMARRGRKPAAKH